jgi:hypothetical protein
MVDPNPLFQPSRLSEAEQKKLALETVVSAWEAALAKGVGPEMLASTAIFAALTDMIDLYGEEAVAQMCATLASRVREGEFTLSKE